MRRRQWSSQEKLKIVLEGLSGQKDINHLCKKHKISQTQYYRWRDRLMKFGYHAFDKQKNTQEEKQLREDNKRLKKILGEVMIELKKIDSGIEKQKNPKEEKNAREK
jgi:transposase-like protein